MNELPLAQGRRAVHTAVMLFDRRHELREPIALRIKLASGAIAITRDLGSCGMYFHMPLDQSLEDWIHLEFDLDHSGLRATALGEVLRTEFGAGSKGVAMRLHHLQLRTID